MSEIRKFTIVVEADNDNAMAEAIFEATNKIREGYHAGKDRNDEAAYYFKSTDDVPDKLRPAR